MNDLRPSVRATYDSRETGPRYWVTTEIDGRTVAFRQPLDDPFVRITVRVTWLARLTSLFRRDMTVTCTVGGDPQVMNDVLELDDNTLVPGRSRRAAFQQSIHGKLGNLGEQ